VAAWTFSTNSTQEADWDTNDEAILICPVSQTESHLSDSRSQVSGGTGKESEIIHKNVVDTDESSSVISVDSNISTILIHFSI
jgi:hypothetical protein